MSMGWHPLYLMRMIFAVLVTATLVVGLSTRARPRSRRDWALVWVVFVLLAWALLGAGWLRSR
jgi:hypothetical protein